MTARWWLIALALSSVAAQPVGGNNIVDEARAANTAQNAFGLKLIAELSADSSHRNVFVSRCRTVYKAEANTLDFLNPQAADVINDWVRRNTRNKIDGIVSQRSVAASKAILTNAVYFKGK